MIKNIRESYNPANKKLRRARRLYLKLCADAITKNPEALNHVIQRAVKSGLYSDTTLRMDIAYSFIKAAYLKNGDNIGFYQFCREKNLYFR